jgi:predicted O-linked N-acetylglucosamine transferase (SPINDLY family)
MVQQVVDDGIVILVDLAGHSARNRFDIFACSPVCR